MNKALLATVAMLLLLEAATRWLLFPASEDFVRFAGYDAQAQALVESPGTRIAVVGNSAAEEGIDSGLLGSELERIAGHEVSVDRFLADGSEIVTWDALVARYFWRAQRAPDVLVVNYFESLADRPNFEYVRIGQFFTTPAQWGYYLREQLPDVSTRMEFLLAASWATYGARDRLRDRALTMVVPGYQALLDRTHTAAEPADAARLESAARYSALDRMLGAARERGTRIVLVAFPLRTVRYDIEAAVRQRAQRGEFALLDLRATEGLQPSSYRDGIHLVPAGRDVYTRRLARELAVVLPKPARAQ